VLSVDYGADTVNVLFLNFADLDTAFELLSTFLVAQEEKGEVHGQLQI